MTPGVLMALIWAIALVLVALIVAVAVIVYEHWRHGIEDWLAERIHKEEKR